MKNNFFILIAFVCIQVNAANFTVTNTNDTGSGSLRQAIVDANNVVGQDTVIFNIAGAGPHVIQPLTNLPIVTDALVINGYSQSGSSVNTQLLGTDANLLIILDGILNTSSPSSGITIQSNGGAVSGISIVRFADSGVLLASGATLVSGNFIGILPDGTTANSNGIGIHIASNLSQFNLIGGSVVGNKNLISGNIFEGVLVESDSNRVLGNIIGTDRTGTIALSNITGNTGVKILNTDNNIIGGLLPAERNLISGNGGGGIDIDGTFNAVNSQIINNNIGLDVTEQSAIGNGIAAGINMLDVDGAQIMNNLVGGNLSGIFLLGLSRNVIIENNTIGGNINTGNATGIQIFNGPGPNMIGNPITQVGNIISFNTANGIVIERTDTQENRIMFNSIFSNGGLGIDLTEGSFGINPNDPLDVDFGANTFLNFPTILSSQNNSGMLQITGNYSGLINQGFIFEVFANQQCSASGNGEGELILGYITGTTDASGDLSFTQNFPIPPTGFNFITMLATDSNGNTSEFSQCFETTGSVASFNVNVNVAGLTVGNTVEFQNNLTDNLMVNTNGISQFMNSLVDGSNYSVTVLNQPTTPVQFCTVINASGIIGGADALINVNCMPVVVLPMAQVIPATSWITLMFLVLLIVFILNNNLNKVRK